ncbi:MAG: hypothetical protein QM831_18960 [Kofleriaceae bacterium]
MKAILLSLSLMFAGTAIAQPQPPRQNKVERVKKRIRALRAYTLVEELGLDAKDSERLFPVLDKYDEEFEKLYIDRAQLQKQLDGADSNKDKKQVDKLIDDSLANQRAIWNTEEKRVADVRKILTPAQVAKMLVVLPALEKKIQNQLRNALNGGKPGAGAKARGRDLDDDDDIEPDEKPPPPKKQQGNNPKATPRCDPFTDLHGCK